MIASLAMLCIVAHRVELAAVGDVMLSRYVGRRAAVEGADILFNGAADEIRQADVAFLNLECVLGDAPASASKRFVFVAPSAYAGAIASAGFDVASVANNHTLDAGKAGFDQTVAALQKAGVQTVGHDGLVVVERKGLRIGSLAYCDFSCGHRELDEESIRSEVAGARDEADAVVVSWHWGVEGSEKPSPRQRRLARLAAQAGADVVLGHHPHVIQPVEWVSEGGRRTLVAYSLGNFVFDPPNEAQRRSAILKVRLGRGGAESFSLSPYRIERYAPQKVGAGESAARQSGLTPRNRPRPIRPSGTNSTSRPARRKAAS